MWREPQVKPISYREQENKLSWEGTGVKEFIKTHLPNNYSELERDWLWTKIYIPMKMCYRVIKFMLAKNTLKFGNIRYKSRDLDMSYRVLVLI